MARSPVTSVSISRPDFSIGTVVSLWLLLLLSIEDTSVNRTQTVGLVLLIAAGIQLWITTQVSGYNLQVLSAVVTIGLALAAVVALYRSLDTAAG